MKLAPARFLLVLLFLAALAAAVACRMPGAHLAGLARINTPSTLQAGPTSQAARPPVILDPADFPRHGLLRLVIRWPERPQQGFKTALIPTNAESIAVWVWAGVPGKSPQIGQPVKAARQSGQATTSVDVDLPEGRNLSVQVKAYRESAPDLATAEAIALGTAAGINIAYNQVTSAKIVLEPLFIPAITAFDSNFGPVGSTVTLTGLNLYDGTGSTVVVAFNGATASVVQPKASSSVQAVVPAGATSGPVTVVRDGVRSSSDAKFWVASAIDLVAPTEAWDPSPADQRIVIKNQTLSFYALPASFAAAPGFDLTQLGASPSATMSVGGFLDDPSVGSFPAGGSFQAGDRVATASLRARWAGLDSSNALIVSIEDVTVALTPGKGILGAFGDASIAFKAESRLSGGATSSLVTISSLAPDLVSVQNGLAQPTASGSTTGGYATIEAVSGLHPGRKATASVAVTVAQVATLAGSGGQGFVDGSWYQAYFSYPFGVAVDAAGVVYVSDQDNGRIRKVTPDRTVSTLAGGSWVFAGPGGLAVGASGDVFVADTGYHRIAKVTADGSVSTLAGSGTQGFADGLGTLARFNNPRGVAVDAAGNVYVADTSNNRVRKVFPDGTVTTLAGGNGEFNGPWGVAVDRTGNVYVADRYSHRIRKISQGVVSTLAGGSSSGFADGAGSQARFNYPTGVALDKAGNLYVADQDNHRIRKVTAAGGVSTLAGSGCSGYGCGSFADGWGTLALFNEPTGVAVDEAGNVYVADYSNHRIRKISEKPLAGLYLGDLAVEIE